MKFTLALPLSLFMAAMPMAVPSANAEVQNNSRVIVIKPNPASLAWPASDILKMTESGVEEEIIQAYIDNNTTPFNLTAENVLYLEDQGVSTSIVTSMLEHDTELREARTTPSAEPAQPTQPQNQPEAEMQNPAQAEPQPSPPAANQSYVDNPPPEVATFYEPLSPYGSWMYLTGYGWCWQPGIASSNPYWRPYFDDGRWLYSDRGWYWDSQYTWGWAPFHYGRWWRADCGWVWFPGSTWAPSWVTWRYDNRFCGWAPLPPAFGIGIGFDHRFNDHRFHQFDHNLHARLRANDFEFVRFHDMLRHDLRDRRLSPGEVRSIFNRTAIARNLSRGPDNTVINRGVPLSRVERLTGASVPTLSVQRSQVDPQMGRPGLTRLGNRDVITRPQLRTPPATVTGRMTAQRIDPSNPGGPLRGQFNGHTPRVLSSRNDFGFSQGFSAPNAVSPTPRAVSPTPRAVSPTPRAVSPTPGVVNPNQPVFSSPRGTFPTASPITPPSFTTPRTTIPPQTFGSAPAVRRESFSPLQERAQRAQILQNRQNFSPSISRDARSFNNPGVRSFSPSPSGSFNAPRPSFNRPSFPSPGRSASFNSGGNFGGPRVGGGAAAGMRGGGGMPSGGGRGGGGGGGHR